MSNATTCQVYNCDVLSGSTKYISRIIAAVNSNGYDQILINFVTTKAMGKGK